MTEKSLLHSLLEHKVKFVVIGGLSLPHYGFKRFTQDVDIFIEPTTLNVQRVIAALQKVGYDIVEQEHVKLFLSKKVLLRDYVVQTDIHPFVKGSNFNSIWKNKIEVEMFGVKVFIPHIDDLLAMKKAAGRLKDKADILWLEEFKKQTKKKR